MRILTKFNRFLRIKERIPKLPSSFVPGVSGETCPTWPFHQRFSIKNRQEGFSEQKTQNRVLATRELSIPNDCILSITVFHVAMLLPNKEWRQSGEHELICYPPCLRMGLRNARNLESGMRNSQSFKCSLVGAFLFYLSKITPHLQYLFHLLIYRCCTECLRSLG